MNTKTIGILIGLAVLIIIVIAAIFQFSKPASQETSMTQQSQEEQNSPVALPNEEDQTLQETPQEMVKAVEDTQAPQQASFDPAKQYTATLATEKGDIVIQLNKGQTPKTVENFITLAGKKFYDGTIFHRTIKGFMIQGGDPKGDGTGGPGYRFDDEPFAGEYARGTVAMANAGPNTNGSQFFIMHQDYALPKNYVIFGKVIKGLDAVDAIATAPTQASSMGEQSKPLSPVKVLSVTVSEK